MAPKPDIYTRVTEKIIADLEAGTRPWHKPWSAEHLAGRITRPLRHNGVAYRGLNIILLWAASVAQRLRRANLDDLSDRHFELGGQVRKGSKGRTGHLRRQDSAETETDDAGEDRDVEIPFMKGYTVFNVDQIEGLPEQYYAVAEPMPETTERDAIR